MSGYDDVIHTAAPWAGTLSRTSRTTKAWLALTGQDVRVDKACSCSHGERAVQFVLLRGLLLPLADRFRQLGVHVALRGAGSTGQVLERRVEGVAACYARCGTCLPWTARCAR